MTGAEFARQKESARVQAYYYAHHEELLAKNRARLQTPESKAYQKAWKKANPDKVRRNHRRYYEKNREKILAQRKEQREKRKEEATA